MSERTGRLVVHPDGYEIAYWTFGTGEQTLLALHGGLGVSDHRHLLPLCALAGDDLRVVLYDQLGSGDADDPDDPAMWTVPRFVGELDSVRHQLASGPVHLLGHSWGGQLALQYTLDHPEHVTSLIMSNAGPSGAEMVRGIAEVRLGLDSTRFMRMWRHEVAGTFDHPEYREAVRELVRRHVFRDPAPEERDKEATARRAATAPGSTYLANWGPNDFCPVSELLEWDVTDRLGEIAVPTLVLTGLHDQVSLACHRALTDGIDGSELVIFGNSSHTPFAEREAACYLAVVRDFLDRSHRPGCSPSPQP